MALQSSGTPIKFSQLMAELLLDEGRETNFGSSGGVFRTLADLSTDSAIKFSDFYDQRHHTKRTTFTMTVEEVTATTLAGLLTDTGYGYVQGDTTAGVTPLTPSKRFTAAGPVVGPDGLAGTNVVAVLVYNDTDNEVLMYISNFYLKEDGTHTTSNPVYKLEFLTSAGVLVDFLNTANTSSWSGSGVFSIWTWNNISSAIGNLFTNNEGSAIKFRLTHSQHQTADNHTPDNDGNPL